MRRWVVLGVLLATACGGDGGEPSGVAGSGGGEAASGGVPGAGGDAPSGGTQATGGVPSAGGLASTGGAPASTGGAATGGLATGGQEATGGMAPSDDAGPTETDAGAAEDDGGIGSGGSPGTGGATATGGVTATGGAVASGGTGGAAATGGAPACECASGPCCDGCHFRPDTYACLGVPTNGTQDTPYSTECNALKPITCDSGREGIIEQMKKQWCTGLSAQCDGRTYPISERWRDCARGSSCRVVGSGLTAAQCAPCGGG